MLKIGSVKLENRVVAAPLAGITDRAFRTILQSMGCGLVFTEMVSDMGLLYNSNKSRQIAEPGEEEGPVAVQIFGSDPGAMAQAAHMVEKMGADIIDINIGCPTPKIVRNGEGAALMLEPELSRKIIRSVVTAVQVPVTVKMRKGWDDERCNYLQMADIAVSEGVRAITLHPRTRMQFFSGQADWQAIAEVKRHSTVPVIGSGDINKAEDAVRMVAETGCDAVMIGRGALGNPFLIRETIALLEHGQKIQAPSQKEKITLAIRHLELAIHYKGEHIAVREMRKHISWYTKGMPAAARLRDQINHTVTRQEMMKILEGLLV
ncbi:MAG TPA: tRNA dihydrouridine synthase DusB [Syntrophomonas sp.]|nr:tRNA dihydrouridine synthase DusB [Syntrophomonas sp.]HRW12071.1 tRNA dihydrouridine synthase DusB [Syntrophomonas sp.]